MTALFSGIRVDVQSSNGLNIYRYVQNIPVPSYLIAIGAGKVEYRKLSDRCGVWAEPELADAAAKEFVETEIFLSTAEKYLTPYEWKTYDILVLPPGFPYGGMENPNLTFVTPSLIAGDKSLVNVIAHEIAHSWTGNLVTNNNWENFWINEGFTMFLERKVIDLVYGHDMFLVEAQDGYESLITTAENLGVNHSFSSMTPDTRDVSLL
jgi:leukotriene-A4 hydrolase